MIVNRAEQHYIKRSHKSFKLIDGDCYCRCLRITGNNIVTKILNKIYEDSENLNLERKYSRYIELIQYIQEKGDM